MELILRLIGFIIKALAVVVMPLIGAYNRWRWPHNRRQVPASADPLLELAAVDLADRIRNRQLSVVQAVRAYIERVREVDAHLNAVVEDRFEAALVDAERMDAMIAGMRPLELLAKYPLCGVPFTVKESCALKGLSFSVGSLRRKGMLAHSDGVVVARLREAGAIPLLVSNTPEFCTSWETNNQISGRSLNPHDLRRTPGGSSGGEGALIGAGASLFGVASDVAGSIRIPAMFNGVFGHKPTGGAISIEGHFPNTPDKRFVHMLTVGPICRYARDLPTLVHLMAGAEQARLLRLDQPCLTRDIAVFYMENAGFSAVDVPVQPEIKVYMRRAVEHFKRNGLRVQQAPLDTFQHSLEVSMGNFVSMQDIPSILSNPSDPKDTASLTVELSKLLLTGQSMHSLSGLFVELLLQTNAFIAPEKISNYVEQTQDVRKQLLAFLGDDGVLFYPTYPLAAVQHNESLLRILGTMYTMIFNVLGFPSTNVPMGRDLSGMPVGMQVVAAPYQDRLCLCMAGELEAAFGGWIKPF